MFTSRTEPLHVRTDDFATGPFRHDSLRSVAGESEIRWLRIFILRLLREAARDGLGRLGEDQGSSLLFRGSAPLFRAHACGGRPSLQYSMQLLQSQI
ncbi:hypothetical protein MESS4_60038 [Mesorhizobium sp. STM 4661]|nr:hypothetical protein MESS4_60038 [Mesorhizobium sp. STM 4661]